MPIGSGKVTTRVVVIGVSCARKGGASTDAAPSSPIIKAELAKIFVVFLDILAPRSGPLRTCIQRGVYAQVYENTRLTLVIERLLANAIIDSGNPTECN